jgi:ribosome-associated protein
LDLIEPSAGASDTPHGSPVNPRQLAERCARVLYERKAEDVRVLDLRKLAGVADFFVIATGVSNTHVRALADHLEEEMKEVGTRPWHVEGYEAERWILLDYVSVVVHVFQPRTREYYMLERLWGDADKVEIDHLLSD